MKDIWITGAGVLCALGGDCRQVFSRFEKQESGISILDGKGEPTAVGSLPSSAEHLLALLLTERKAYRDLDRSVLLAILAAREAWEASSIAARSGRIGVNFGSSRGATGLFERYLHEFETHQDGKTATLTSPTTTLGNVSSWIAQDLSLCGPTFSHSVTCSSALQAIGNALAWLRADMADVFIAGGTEASLTPFTIAQMKALRIYSERIDDRYPCRPCTSLEPASNSFVLGEGAAAFVIARTSSIKTNSFRIESYGSAMEPIQSPTAISEQGIALQRAMSEALDGLEEGSAVDAVILHAPGTVKGDRAELRALQAVFSGNPPWAISTKFWVGHTLGASGGISLAYALYLLQGGTPIEVPYESRLLGPRPQEVKRVMVNATGFGGNAVSVIVARP